MTNFVPATYRQVNFLDDLVKSREIPVDEAKKYEAVKANLDLKTASNFIATFLTFPKRAVVRKGFVEEPLDPIWAELNEALMRVPQSKYAIPVSELMTDFLKDPVHGDLVFLEVREYMKRIYMKKLFGSVGAFTRVRVKPEDALAFVRLVERDPYKYARMFGEHYKCCGKCGAELTDPISRDLMLGPWCRKAFGK